ncbi:MAG: hypothetical protein KJ066_00340 [Acidobacteria bacterium]|nr:hypothetical protein [Acidobacteriota bacterium]
MVHGIVMRVVSLAACLGLPAALAGQPLPDARRSPRQAEGQTTPTPQPSDDWPLSVSRVRTLLEREEARERSRGDDELRLNYYIEVYGKSARIDVLQGFDFTSGAVQYGGMTHREFLDLTTPQAFRSPTMSLSSLAFAAAQWAYERAEKRRREAEERRAREDARRIYDQRPPQPQPR